MEVELSRWEGLDLLNESGFPRVTRCSPLLLELLRGPALSELNLVRGGLLESAGTEDFETRVDLAEDLVIALLVLLGGDLIWDLVIAVLMAGAMGLVGVWVVWSVGSVGFSQRN